MKTNKGIFKMSINNRSFLHNTKCLLVFFILGISLAACSKSSTEPNPSNNIEKLPSRLQAMLDSHFEQMDFPGIVLSVKIDGEDEINLAAGLADIDNNVAAKSTDRFRIASVTKTFTAATILLMQEDGLLNIDQTIDQYVPELNIPKDSIITIRHLLNHTSGLADHEISPTIDLIITTLMQDPTHVFPPAQIINMSIAAGAHFNPGEGFSYSNTGYVILGLIIESVEGSTYSEAVHSRIIEPMGLNNTFVPLPEDESIPGDYLHGYEFINDKLSDLTLTNHSWAFAEGEIISNAHDLSIWTQKLVKGEVFNKASTVAAMQSFIDAGEGLSYGLGLIKNPIAGLGHDGGTIGFSSEAYYNPDTGITIVVGINTGIDGSIIYETLDIIYGVLN